MFNFTIYKTKKLDAEYINTLKVLSYRLDFDIKLKLLSLNDPQVINDQYGRIINPFPVCKQTSLDSVPFQ